MGKKILWLLATEPNEKQLMELVSRYGEDSELFTYLVKHHEFAKKVKEYLKLHSPDVVVTTSMAMKHFFKVKAILLKSTTRPAFQNEKPDFEMVKWNQRMVERRVFLRFVEVQVISSYGSHLIVEEHQSINE